DNELTTTVVEGSGTDVTTSVVGNNTEYTVSAEISSTAGNALSVDANGLYVSDVDNDTQYTAGNGLNLDGSNEFTAAISGNAGNALSLVGGELFATDTDTQYSAGTGLTLSGTTFSVDASSVNTDDQNATEVAIFPSEDTNADSNIDNLDTVTLDMDGDFGVDPDGVGPLAAGVRETTVQEALVAIEPITSKAARIFYPPSIAIDVSAYSGTNITGETKDLYQEYINQYAPTAPPFTATFVASTNAPTAIPTYEKEELYYYVTFYDDTVFDNVSIDADGVMTYDIIGSPADYNSLINVVFVVK
ncbi:hypothetical protein, partial [Maribacter sp. 2210JD10-5]|uniref:hypothetical protein n=1 Tax=Maribacter sp. 2210JD10-5 TaxID=3386272 RepID=UPI0039BD7117